MFQDAFVGDGSDLYDEVLSAPANSLASNGQDDRGNSSIAPIDRIEPSGDTNGNSYGSQNSINHIPRRHQLYVGNLTWVRLFQINFHYNSINLILYLFLNSGQLIKILPM